MCTTITYTHQHIYTQVQESDYDSGDSCFSSSQSGSEYTDDERSDSSDGGGLERDMERLGLEGSLSNTGRNGSGRRNKQPVGSGDMAMDSAMSDYHKRSGKLQVSISHICEGCILRVI